MNFWFTSLSVLAVLVMSPMIIAAQATSDSFIVNQFFGDPPTFPPTVPADVVAEPIASSQIDISWSASTHIAPVVGYQVFRDLVQVATTSLTTFSDNGLQASTTYSYTIRAFDGFGNVSSSSAPVATTTFALPPPPPSAVTPTSTPSRSFSSRAPEPELRSFSLLPGMQSALVEFVTSVPTQYVLRYSKAETGGDRFVQTERFSTNHTTVLIDLEPGQKYVYELSIIDRYNQEVLARQGEFTTEPLFVFVSPQNVGNLQASILNTDVQLRWQNPQQESFAFVRVVRNHRFFPQNPTDGFVVYEGSATSVIDQRALAEFNRQYYTVFTFDENGNRSSGAVVRVQLATASDSDIVQPVSPELDEDVATSTLIDMTQMRLQAEDIMFLQGSSQTFASNGLVILDAYEGYEISVPAAAVPNHLKSIIVTVQHPTDNKISQSFLLRYDEESDSYLARIAPFSVLGDSTFTVAVYDYTAAVLYEVTLPVRFVGSDEVQSPLVPVYVSYAWSILWPLIQLLLIGLTFIWFIVLWRRRNTEVDIVSNEDNR